jgi:hypothetical protein
MGADGQKVLIIAAGVLTALVINRMLGLDQMLGSMAA